MILLYQHDQAQLRHIRRNIQQIGQQCQSFDSVETFSAACLHHQIAIIDLEIPGQCCFDVCQQLRSQNPKMSLIAVTTATSETDHILALELGADDVITLPCHDRAFQARVKVQLRRTTPVLYSSKPVSPVVDYPYSHQNNDVLQCGLLQLNIKSHATFIGGEPLALTATEFALLNHFMTHPNQVFTRNQLLNAVWGHQLECYEHTVVSHINRLRAKLSCDKQVAAMLETVRGVGYRLTSPVTEAAQQRSRFAVAVSA